MKNDPVHRRAHVVIRFFAILFVSVNLGATCLAGQVNGNDWNFHKIVEHFYRSKRPSEEFLRYLKSTRNLQTVISLEDDAEAIENEAKMCARLGIGFISMPMKHWEIQSHAYTMAILDKIDWELGQGKTTLIHCAEGKDRTGLIVALFRILRQFPRWSDRPWSRQEALDEMLKYGFHEKFTPLLGHFNWEYDHSHCSTLFGT